jgi:hypothetical protein
MCGDAIANYQTKMKSTYKQKKSIIEYCMKVMHNSELEAETKSVELISKIQGIKKHKIREIEESADKGLSSDEFEAEMLGLVDQLEDDLMEIEMKLQYALQEAFETYQNKIKVIMKEMEEDTDKFIKVIDAAALEFNNELAVNAVAEFTHYEEKLKENDDVALEDMEEDEEDKLADLFQERETLDSTLEMAKEFMQKKITATESLIMNSIKKEQNANYEQIRTGQHTRNRGIVREIISTCNIFRTEIKEEANNLRGEEDD